MGRAEPSKMYDAYYFAHSCGRPYARDEEWLRFFGLIAEHIASDIQPKSVLDAGCAWGLLVEMLRQRNVEAYGIDIPLSKLCSQFSVVRCEDGPVCL